eukprot:2590438-Amphidinium_carterae.1
MSAPDVSSILLRTFVPEFSFPFVRVVAREGSAQKHIPKSSSHLALFPVGFGIGTLPYSFINNLSQDYHLQKCEQAVVVSTHAWQGFQTFSESIAGFTLRGLLLEDRALWNRTGSIRESLFCRPEDL